MGFHTTCGLVTLDAASPAAGCAETRCACARGRDTVDAAAHEAASTTTTGMSVALRIARAYADHRRFASGLLGDIPDRARAKRSRGGIALAEVPPFGTFDSICFGWRRSVMSKQ